MVEWLSGRVVEWEERWLLMGAQNRLHVFLYLSSFKRLLNIHHQFVSLT